MKIFNNGILLTYEELKDYSLWECRKLYNRTLARTAKSEGYMAESFPRFRLDFWDSNALEGTKEFKAPLSKREQEQADIITALFGAQEEVGDSSEDDGEFDDISFPARAIEAEREQRTYRVKESFTPDIEMIYDGSETFCGLIFEGFSLMDLIHVANLIEDRKVFHWVNGSKKINLAFQYKDVARHLDGNFEVNASVDGGLEIFKVLNRTKVNEVVAIFEHYDKVLREAKRPWELISDLVTQGNKVDSTEEFYKFLEDVASLRRKAFEAGDYKDPVRRAILKSEEWELGRLNNYDRPTKKYLSVVFTPKDYRKGIDPEEEYNPCDKGIRRNNKFFNPVTGDNRSTEQAYGDRCFEDKNERFKSNWW